MVLSDIDKRNRDHCYGFSPIRKPIDTYVSLLYLKRWPWHCDSCGDR